MAIFSRRNVQRMLDENDSFIPKKVLQDQVNKLNKNDFQSLDTEWEIAVLNALSKVGTVEHEKNFGGTTNPDIFFTTTDGHSFIADVRSVSDEGFEDQNPVEYFQIELQQKITKAGITGGGFHLTIERMPMESIDDATNVALPNRGQFHAEVFTGEFKKFLNEIKNNSAAVHTFSVDTEKTKITLRFEPGSQFFTMNLPVYTKARKANNNPVFNALKAKHTQLSKSGYTGTRGIILCDGGCDMFEIGFKSPWQPEFNAEDVVERYLAQNKSIDFVLLIRSQWTKKSSVFDPGPARHIGVTINPNHSYPNLPESIKKAVFDLMAQFPEPSNTSAGARKTIRRKYDPKRLSALSGGVMTKGNQLTVSANSVLALLAGNITHDEFMTSIGNRPTPPGDKPNNIFSAMVNNHMRISAVTVGDRSSDDSDITFHFVHDPGTDDFRIP